MINLKLATLCFKISDGLTPIPQSDYGNVSPEEEDRYSQHNGRIIMASDYFGAAGVYFADEKYLKALKNLGKAVKHLFS